MRKRIFRLSSRASALAEIYARYPWRCGASRQGAWEICAYYFVRRVRYGATLFSLCDVILHTNGSEKSDGAKLCTNGVYDPDVASVFQIVSTGGISLQRSLSR